MRQSSKFKRPTKAEFVLTIGRVYLVKRYHTGDFRAKCCESLKFSAKFKVTDPLKSTLAIDDELEISFKLAEFIPAIVEDFRERRA